jgi:hypothetical protein
MRAVQLHAAILVNAKMPCAALAVCIAALAAYLLGFCSGRKVGDDVGDAKNYIM